MKLENQNWEAHYNLALALLKTGDRTGAKRELQAAVQYKPDSVSSHFALGSLWQSENRLDEAAEELKTALTIDPKFVPASLKLSQVLTSQNKLAAAIACLEDALRQSPAADQEEALQTSLGLAYAESGDPKKDLEDTPQPGFNAAQFCRRSLQFRAAIRQKQPACGIQDAALAQYKEALRLDPGMEPSRLALGRLLLSRGNCSDSILALQAYTKHKPCDPEGLHAQGLAYGCLGRANDGIESLKKAEHLDPNNAGVHYDLGVMLAEASRTADAIQELKTAARMDPKDPKAHQQLALLFKKTGNKENERAGRGEAQSAQRTAGRECRCRKAECRS